MRKKNAGVHWKRRRKAVITFVMDYVKEQWNNDVKEQNINFINNNNDSDAVLY